MLENAKSTRDERAAIRIAAVKMPAALTVENAPSTAVPIQWFMLNENSTTTIGIERLISVRGSNLAGAPRSSNFGNTRLK